MIAITAFLALFCDAKHLKRHDVDAGLPKEDRTPPNVIFFVTDDWGFNDVGYNGNTDTQTPFIDEIATTESLIISKHYVQPLCTPSRAALLTGRYPMRYGFQAGTITLGSPFALSQYEYLLSSEFKNQDYSTHIVGYAI